MQQSSRLVQILNRGVLFLSFTVVAARPIGQGGQQSVHIAVGEHRVPLNRQARQFVAAYIRENREDLHLAKCRSRYTFRMIDKVFAQYGLPAEMKYLAVIESGMKSGAISCVGAKGIWQLMPQTAQQLGLKVEAGRDERTLNYKSTVAAAKYLRDLYGEFGDWLLVLAAYNSGPGPVYRAMKRSGSRDFWVLQNYLPAESRLHVKRFIASHYYFEGKGSVATLTKGEWAVFAANRPDQGARTMIVRSGRIFPQGDVELPARSSRIFHQDGAPTIPAMLACLTRRGEHNGLPSAAAFPHDAARINEASVF